MRELIVDLNQPGAVKVLQRGLGVEVDGLWGPITQRAWNAHTGRPPPPEPFDVPLDWLPMARMQRIILHWTGGGPRASDTDKQHYHLLIEDDGTLIRGVHPITANEVLTGKSSSQYAAHVARLNTGSIGIGLCGMACARESPLDFGDHPLTATQWKRACTVLAALADRYAIPVDNRHVLTHAEVEPNLGVRQANKWDITVLAFDPTCRGHRAVGDKLREQVLADLARLKR